MKKKNTQGDKVTNRYKLSVFNEATFKESFTMQLSKVNVFIFLGTLFLLVTALVIALFIVTPLNDFLPRYNDASIRLKIIETTIKIDSLEKELNKRDFYFQNIKNVMEGKDLSEYVTNTDTTTVKYNDLKFTKSIHDSILRTLIETEEKNSLDVVNKKKNDGELKHLTFYAPVRGLITSKFDYKLKHYGTDVVAAEDEPILSVLDGTVIIASWSLETGYVIQIQHESNLISVYKHNSVLLKKEGDFVKAGESIAIIGNSGELSTGPHLHFELWHNGIPLDPENYINF